jgi:hypothetical protein
MNMNVKAAVITLKLFRQSVMIPSKYARNAARISAG